ncbi:MAG: PilZ domain-containing protein [Candidatus Omnitrophica bacterium]|nr:PilZ domain-containing protein [Candidatus Omnitrophota bacterium]
MSENKPKRRVSIRRRIKCSVYYGEYKPRLRQQDMKTAFIKDISSSGALIAAEEKFGIGNFLTMEIMLPGWQGFSSTCVQIVEREDPNVLRLTSRVVRVHEVSKELYNIAVTFFDIADQDKQMLDQYMRSRDWYQST